MVYKVTKKEADLQRCAFMILRDECPPDRAHYLCMKVDEDPDVCFGCWYNYLHGVAAGTIELPSK